MAEPQPLSPSALQPLTSEPQIPSSSSPAPGPEPSAPEPRPCQPAGSETSASGSSAAMPGSGLPPVPEPPAAQRTASQPPAQYPILSKRTLSDAELMPSPLNVPAPSPKPSPSLRPLNPLASQALGKSAGPALTGALSKRAKLRGSLKVELGITREPSFQLMSGAQGLATFQYHIEDPISGQRRAQQITEVGAYRGWRSQDFILGPELGRGEGGSVRIARHRQNGTDYALKEVEVIDRSTRHQLEREVQTYAHCGHSLVNIVQLFDVYYLEGRVCMVLELMNWGALDMLLQKHDKEGVKRMKEPLLAAIFGSILQAVRFLHDDHHVVHRDLKPGNVMLHRNGSVKLSDFGASHLGCDSAHAGAGTMGYMSPEQLEGTVGGKKCDIWALGIIGYECASGTHPYRHQGTTPIEFYTEVVNDPSPTLKGLTDPELSEQIITSIDSCFNKDPDLRPHARDLVANPVIEEYVGTAKSIVSKHLSRFDGLVPAFPRTRSNAHLLDAIGRSGSCPEVPVTGTSEDIQPSLECSGCLTDPLPSPPPKRPSSTASEAATIRGVSSPRACS